MDTRLSRPSMYTLPVLSKQSNNASSENYHIILIWTQTTRGEMSRINEPRCGKIGPGFPTMSDKNRAVYPKKMARGLKFRI